MKRLRRSLRGGPAAWLAGLFCGLALLAGPAVQARAAACPPTPQPYGADELTRAQDHASDRGFLWRLEGPDPADAHPSWLYGTIHIARRDWVLPGRLTRQALQQADLLALELDPLDPDILRRLQQAMRAEPGAAALPADIARRLQMQTDLACLGQALDGLRPEMQAVTLSVLALRDRGLDPAYGVDAYLAGLARALNKPVLSLETPEAQIGLLLQADAGATANFVDEALSSLEDGSAVRSTERLALAWSLGRLDELETYAQWCQCLQTETQRAEARRMIDERNLSLAADIARRHKSGLRLFVAVGALHLSGPEGVAALLARSGWRVERVPGHGAGQAPAASR